VPGRCHDDDDMSGHGHQIFTDGLVRLATHAAAPRLAALARRIGAPVTVTVHGRHGVGVSTVTRVLTAAGIGVRDAGADVADADIDVRVIAEVVKPEDVAALKTGRPTLTVLNKADLAGFSAGGPIAAARARCADFAAATGTSVSPLVALLAMAGLDPGVLDDAILESLRVLIAAPADLSSPDAFVSRPHRLPRAARQRLAERLDLFGIAHAVLALRAAPDTDADELRRLWRRASCVDEVCARIDGLAAEVRYRRMLAAITELEAMASRCAWVDAFLNSDRTAEARMHAAAEVMSGAGIAVDTGVGAEAHLRRAVRWQRYSAGPVTALHRSCSADIARGSLRLLAGGGP
jgi:hypothetical protein